jgi:hypothetical protein
MKTKVLCFKLSNRSTITIKIISITTKLLPLLAIALFMVAPLSKVKALPSYARQTQMSCTACHTSFPELNNFGRQFKLNGYTMTTMPTIDAQGSDTTKPSTSKLKLLSTLPLSVMLQSSFTHISKDVAGTQNNSVAFPQQLSMFFAGQITPHIGSFIQMTYADGAFGMDNADVRYANTVNIGSKSLLYGLSLNNNPTVQDVWNTSPAWRYPSASSASAPTPAKSTILENLGTQVAGLGAYTLINNLVFAEISGYRSAQQGAGANPATYIDTLVIKRIAPYWRFALQHQWSSDYLELGTFGIASNHFQNGITGNMSKFVDMGVDLQFEHIMSFGYFSLHAALINEKESREVTDTAQNTSKLSLSFNSFKVDANLYLKNGLGATVGYFNNTGTEDVKVQSLTNKPNSSGFISQLELLSMYNTKFAVQYVSYQKFDGSKTNYDGAGRNAAHNNAIYLLAWFCF